MPEESGGRAGEALRLLRSAGRPWRWPSRSPVAWWPRPDRGAGASRAFAGSVTAYATRLKQELLGVDGATAGGARRGRPGVAAAMARGVRERLGADWGLATTGVAGPDPQDGKPVGTVYVAVAGPPKRLLRPARPVPVTAPAIRAATVDGAL